MDAVEEVEGGRGLHPSLIRHPHAHAQIQRQQAKRAVRGASGHYKCAAMYVRGSGTGMAHRRGTEKQAGGVRLSRERLSGRGYERGDTDRTGAGRAHVGARRRPHWRGP